MRASSPVDSPVDPDSFGPIGRPITDPRFFHLAMAFGLILGTDPQGTSGSLDCLVSFDGQPPSSGHCRVEPVP